ncbi:Ankyrin repeat family protein [Euphorbia peplus]|nr:Ankyrin repeat family protein [Euphorbia peplus]
MTNDWRKAESLYEKRGMKYGTIITPTGETALHVAALAGHIDFVENLVGKMEEDEIRIATRTSWNGNTSFHCAAMSGNVKIAQTILIKDNKLRDLAMARGFPRDLPIDMAASKGNKEMVRYLYRATKDHLLGPNCDELWLEDRTNLLLALIRSDIYDVALDMTKAILDQHIASESMEEEALQALAQRPLNPPRFLDRFVGFFWRQWDKNEMYKNAVELVKLLWKEISHDEKRAGLIKENENLISEAVKQGNFEFLSILIASYPDILFKSDGNGYSIFHHAVLHRRVDIFKLIHIGAVKRIVTAFTDMEGNHLLHLAGKLPPPSRLNIVPGAALQLQLELLWFEEVKKVMEPHQVNRKTIAASYLQLQKSIRLVKEMRKIMKQSHLTIPLFEKLEQVIDSHCAQLEEYFPLISIEVQRLFEAIKMVMDNFQINHCNEEDDTRLESDFIRVLQVFKEMKKVMELHEELTQTNNLEKEEYTPHELFVKEHKNLMEEGEKWMRDTANSCMIVTALIATIAFAAAITVPGGNGDNGYPQFVSEMLFKVFAIADSISLISSTTSLLGFLSILTARYQVDDFRWSLPNKLFIGLLTLFVSIVAMMVAFVLSIFIIFKNTPPGIVFLLVALASLPIVLFIWHHLGLFFDVFRSTYMPRLLFKSRMDPNLLFKEKNE